MKLQTTVPLHAEDEQIDYRSSVLLLGSCFVENIGSKLEYYQFQTLQNPFGILFHSESIDNLIERAIEEANYSDADVFYTNERWHSLDAHSDLSDPSKELLLTNLNNALVNTRNQLTKATHIIITLGTAWVYRDVATQKRVANCHKLPQNQFTKELLEADEIEASLKRIISNIRKVNGQASVILTISPVRHLKDGFVENQRSKAHLVSAIGKINKSALAHKKVSYFPAYELMLDELRDYRFYAEDMVHPNSLAMDYIWEKFKYVWVSGNTEKVMKTVQDIQKGLKHVPFNESSVKHQLFLNSLKKKIAKLKKEYTFMNFDR